MKHKIEVLERQVAALLDERDKLKDGYLDEVGPLRAFAQAVMECWPMGDLDGGTLQDAAVKHGLLIPETRHAPCTEGCNCSQYADAQEWVFGVVCYRKTPLLTGSNVEVTGAARLYRAASSDRRERGRLPGWARCYTGARQNKTPQKSALATRRLHEARR